jgi:hypothetical protein
MPDDAEQPEQPDRSQVWLTKSDDVDYWTRRFGVSREQLEDAINVVGNSVEAVEQRLHPEATTSPR